MFLFKPHRYSMQLAMLLGTTTVLSVCVNLPTHAELTSNQGKTVMIPAGTTFEGRIDTSIGSAHSHPGQRFCVTMASPALGNGQDVIIPAGSQFLGEVVEAISSGHQPKQKGYNKPLGKLRVQLTGLRIPDGSTFPVVASFIGDAASKNGQAPNDLGTGVAYVGTQSGFNMMYPRGGGRGGPLVSKQAMLSNPLFGDPDRSRQNQGQNKGKIRSLVRQKNELVIQSGSPMSVRLDTPLRLSLTPVAPAAAPYAQGNDFTPQADSSGRRFSHDPATAQVAQPKSEGQNAGPADDTPTFLTPVKGATSNRMVAPAVPLPPASSGVPTAPTMPAPPAIPGMPAMPGMSAMPGLSAPDMSAMPGVSGTPGSSTAPLAPLTTPQQATPQQGPQPGSSF